MYIWRWPCKRRVEVCTSTQHGPGWAMDLAEPAAHLGREERDERDRDTHANERLLFLRLAAHVDVEFGCGSAGTVHVCDVPGGIWRGSSTVCVIV